MLDRVVHGCFVIVLSLKEVYKNWKTFGNTNGGRRKFQIKLGLQMMNYGIGLDWSEPKDGSRRPHWVRRKVVSCNCNECFFCIHGLCNGVFHDKSKIIMSTPGSGKKRAMNVECTYERVRLVRLKYGTYCRQCRRNKKREESNLTYKGCQSRDEPICRECWKNYDNSYHKP